MWSWCGGAEDRDFGRQSGASGNDAGNAAIAIGKVRRDFQPTRAADLHALDAVEKAADERPPVDADVSDQRFAVVLDTCGVCRTPGGCPANGFSIVQPQAKTDSVTLLAAN